MTRYSVELAHEDWMLILSLIKAAREDTLSKEEYERIGALACSFSDAYLKAVAASFPNPDAIERIYWEGDDIVIIGRRKANVEVVPTPNGMPDRLDLSTQMYADSAVDASRFPTGIDSDVSGFWTVKRPKGWLDPTLALNEATCKFIERCNERLRERLIEPDMSRFWKSWGFDKIGKP